MSNEQQRGQAGGSLAPQPKQIPGAKLVKGQWQDLDGNPLSNADLIRLRKAAERTKEQAPKREPSP